MKDGRSHFILGQKNYYIKNVKTVKQYVKSPLTSCNIVMVTLYYI